MTQDTFWDDIQIPINPDWEDNDADFVNPVVVADMFASATGFAATICSDLEALTDKLSKLERQKAKLVKELARIRRDILAEEYKRITKSASPEVQTAFIWSSASSKQRTLMRNYEDKLEVIDAHIMSITAERERLNNRLKRLDRNMDFAREYLNFDKHMAKVSFGQR